MIAQPQPVLAYRVPHHGVKCPAFLLLSLALAGCAVAPQAHLSADPAFKPARYAWDGAGEDPNQPRSGAPRAKAAAPTPPLRAQRSQAGLQPYSKEWWQAQDGIEAEQDAKVTRSLVICQGCLRPQPQSEEFQAPPKRPIEPSGRAIGLQRYALTPAAPALRSHVIISGTFHAHPSDLRRRLSACHRLPGIRRGLPPATPSRS